jgi:hypothetical protein
MAAKKKKKAKKAPARKARKTRAAKAARKAAPKRKAKAVKKAPRKAAARKTPARKAAKKTARKPSTNKEFGEGNYKAAKRFRDSEEGFVRAHKADIAAMGKSAEAALDGPESKDLLAAEAQAAGHAAGEEP